MVITYAPDNEWFISTMNIVFEVGGDLVRKEVAHNLMRLIAEGVTTISHNTCTHFTGYVKSKGMMSSINCVTYLSVYFAIGMSSSKPLSLLLCLPLKSYFIYLLIPSNLKVNL